jgi:hypothetical protein
VALNSIQADKLLTQVRFKKWPGAHWSHAVEPSLENPPGLQSVHALAPDVEKVFAGQTFVQGTGLAISFEYLPASQCEQAPDSSVADEFVKYFPAGQFAHSLAPLDEKVPGAQIWQPKPRVFESNPPLLYVPGMHSVHMVAPVALEYLPVSHQLHVSPIDQATVAGLFA